MGKYNTSIQLKNAQQIIKQLDGMVKGGEKAVAMTVNDFKHRAPAWVAQEVSAEYGIKKADVTPTKKNPKAAGRVSIKGTTIDTAALVYKGRVLTPTRFGMTPKAPKQAYTLKAQIHRGQKKTLGKVKRLTKKQRKNVGRNFRKQGDRNSSKSPIMLMNTGGGKHIPFQRQSKNRKNIKAIKTVSVPQTVSNEAVSKEIENVIQENLSKRMDHYIERYMRK